MVYILVTVHSTQICNLLAGHVPEAVLLTPSKPMILTKYQMLIQPCVMTGRGEVDETKTIYVKV